MLKQGLRRLLVMALVVTMVFSCPTLHIFAEEVEDGTEIIQEESQETPEEEAPAEETPAEPEEEAVEEVAEETTEEPAEEPVEEPVEEPAEVPVEESTEESEEEPVEEPAEEPVEEPAEESDEETVEEPAEEPTEEPTEVPEEEPVEEQPAEEPVEDPAEEPTEELTEEVAEEPEEESEEPELIEHLSQISAGPLKVGEEATATIETGGDTLLYSFVPTKTGMYAFYSDSEYLDTKGVLYNNKLGPIKDDDDSGVGTNFRIEYLLIAGRTYFLEVRFYNSSQTGSFPVHVDLVNEWMEGWHELNGAWYYIKSDGSYVTGMYTIGQKQYIFEENGKLFSNGVYYVDEITAYFCDASGVVDQTPGWKTARVDGEEDKFYVLSTGIVAEGWHKIGGYWYYFIPEMIADCSFKTSSGEYYFFDANGRCIQTVGWVKSSDGRYYYVFDKSGLLYTNGFYTIDGKLYHFNQFGENERNVVFEVDESYYVADSNGVSALIKLGWNAVGTRWIYVEDLTAGPLTNQVKLINGKWYGFDWDGYMYDNQPFYISPNRYRAKKDGSLYVNEWYKDYNTYEFYGEKGIRVVDQVITVGGKNYCIDDNGYLITNQVFTRSGNTYAADAKGVMTQLKEGWNKVDGVYYYIKDGAYLNDTVEEINGSYYGFDWLGRMYANGVFEIDSRYYRAKASGALYTSWLKVGEDYYYYGSDGAALAGLQTVNGKMYFFSETGMMEVNQFVRSGEDLYFCNTGGIATKVTKEGLYYTPYGYVYYVSDGTLLKDTWKSVGGKYYYFSSNGAGYRSTVTLIDGKYYAFDSNSVMYSDTWIYEYSGVRYATPSGALATGEKKIGGKWYYFTDFGTMQTGVVSYNGKLYLCGADGAYIATVKNGWNQIDGTWYYIENNALITASVKTIGGSVYAFDGAGRMLKNNMYEYYILGADGKRVENGWTKFQGAWYYIDPATHEYTRGGKATINGKEYYFDWSGRMFVGERMEQISETTSIVSVYGSDGALTSSKTVKDGWTLINGTYYYYKEGKPYSGWVGKYFIGDGRMLTNQFVDGYWVGKDGAYVTGGWIQTEPYAYAPDGSYYGNYAYAKSGGKLARNEMLQINGSWYYFNGIHMVTGYQIIDGKLYNFGYSGKRSSESLTASNGWKKFGNDWLYIIDGMLTKGVARINGTLYGFNYDGIMVKNDFCYGSGKTYYFGSDGKLAEYTGWKKLNGFWYYFNADHTVRNDLTTIDGKTYYLDPEMVTGWVPYGSSLNTLLYQFDSSGALTGIESKQNGWIQKDGAWYYMKNGALVRYTIETINGKSYGFNYDGRLMKNGTIHSGGNSIYFCGSDGVVVSTKGWKKDAYGYWYYALEDGRCLTGIQKIDGKTYYFDTSGVWIK